MGSEYLKINPYFQLILVIQLSVKSGKQLQNLGCMEVMEYH